MKKRIALIAVIVMMAVIVSPVRAAVPTTSIYAVVKDEAVTVHTADFPAGHTFHVYMGYRDTQGVNGYLVSKLTTNEGGSFNAKFYIPEELKGEDIISIRFESVTESKYYTYNWFFNESATGSIGSSSGTTYNNLGAGVPAWNILSVVKGSSVVIQTRYFPAQQRYAVFLKNGALADLNWYETQGIETDEGNSQIITIAIPPELQYYEKIAIKLYNINDGSYWYNLFDNINQ
ncbi:MAG: hypothetical protein Q7J07_09465 [Pelolinea sp.]|nr:hypothetical protein [Pelolinea sp.]